MLTNHNNLKQFIETKILSFRQVHYAQKRFQYHFQIDYCRGKANKAANTLSHYPQWNAEEETILCVKNIKIFYRLQSSLAKVFGLLTSHFSFSTRSLYAEQLFFSNFTNSGTLLEAG